MSEFYTELMVKKKTTAADKAKKILLIAATILSGVLGFFVNPLLLFILLILIVVDYLTIPKLDLEFEYLYVSGELDVDKIMSKTKRKRVCSLDLTKMVLLAPVNSHDLDYYNQNKNIKVQDFSSGQSDHEVYALMMQTDKGVEKILFEPNETIINDIRRTAPSKVKVQYKVEFAKA